MDLKLQGKRALVTGSSSGIGAATAKMLAEEGVKVVVHGRDRQRAEAVTAAVKVAGGEAAIAIGDLTKEQEADAVIAAAMSAFGGIDILVNNVGGSTSINHPTWFDASLAEWAQDFSANMLVAVRLANAFVPGMRERGWGRVIQVSSRNAISPYAQFGGYGAAKAALNNMTLSLSKALAGTGVTSNGIMPGAIMTPLMEDLFIQEAKKLGSEDIKVGQDYVLKNFIRQTSDHLGQPEDIAFAVCCIASPKNDFMTGTTFRIDGGATPTV
jgi:NAD(P)-dependent dehydrogenase (short-subunit alcohol dehydrogenase family)